VVFHHLQEVPGGLVSYSRGWEMHASLFRVMSSVVEAIAPEDISRGIALLFSCLGYGITLLLLRFKSGYDGNAAYWSGLGIALVLLFSPAAFPWYAVWFAPFLPFMNWRVWLALPPCLSFYYLRFWCLYSEPTFGLGPWTWTGPELFDDLISPVSYMILFSYMAWIFTRSHWSRDRVAGAS